LPVRRLRDARVEPAARARADVCRRGARVPLVGGHTGRAAARARVLARAGRRPARASVGRLRRRAHALHRHGQRVTIPAVLPAPYKVLAPFGDWEADAVMFFGREGECEVIVANLLASKLTVLYGPSGVGKSSILRAAVSRRLREIAPHAETVVVDDWMTGP